jgi:hypothetical protein
MYGFQKEKTTKINVSKVTGQIDLVNLVNDNSQNLCVHTVSYSLYVTHVKKIGLLKYILFEIVKKNNEEIFKNGAIKILSFFFNLTPTVFLRSRVTMTRLIAI